MAAKREVLGRDVGTQDDEYPPAAYRFILEGVNLAMERVHGPLTPAQALLTQYMAAEDIDLEEVMQRREEGVLDAMVSEAIEDAGGLEQLNRHIGGQELCWALRDLAVLKWGWLGPVVLRTWGITGTLDFGRVVFDLIRRGRLQRQPHDRLEDFRDVFDFREAFHSSLHLKTIGD